MSYRIKCENALETSMMWVWMTVVVRHQRKQPQRTLPHQLKVQHTPKLKTGKVVVQTKKNKKDIITGLDEKTQHPFISWGVESIPKRPVDPIFLKVLPIDVDEPQYITPDPTSFAEEQEVVIISGTFAGQIGALKAWTGTSFAILLKIEGEEGGNIVYLAPP